MKGLKEERNWLRCDAAITKTNDQKIEINTKCISLFHKIILIYDSILF